MELKVLYFSGREISAQDISDSPKHLYFGAGSLRKFGVDVAFHPCGKLPLTKFSRLKRSFSSAISLFKKQNAFDLLYASTFTGIELVVIAKRLGIFRRPIVVLAYTEVKFAHGLTGHLYKFFYSGIEMLILSSPLNFHNAKRTGYFADNRLSLLNPGPDVDWYHKIRIDSEIVPTRSSFITSGREERDFLTLLQAFYQRPEKLTILVTSQHGTRHYREFFNRNQHLLSENISLSILDTAQKAQAVAHIALAHEWMICCTFPTSYNTGYTSLQEAVGLGLPIVVNRNPYFGIDVEAEKIGICFPYQDSNALKKALDEISAGGLGLKDGMVAQATQLGRDRWNLDIFSSELAKLLISVASREKS